jgi:hypothetical protein
VRVDHQPYVRPDRGPHLPHGFEILLRSAGRPHLVRGEAKGRDGGGLSGVALWRHIHAGAAVKLDRVAAPAAG